jgi:ectoine hydroxylase-related dioxygenase (phytanoyl-CoA dioxygenase family)
MPSPEQRIYEEFRNQGYYLAEQVVAPEDISLITELAVKFLSCKTKRYKAVEALPEVVGIIAKQKCMGIINLLCGPNVALTLNRHNHVSLNEPGHSNVGFHRDHGEWTRGLLSAVLYLEDADERNGATRIIPGSHNWYSPGYATSDGYWLDDDVYADYQSRATDAVTVPAKSGDVLFFDGMVFHEPGKNTSATSRMSLTLGFHAIDQLMVPVHEQILLVAGKNIYRGNNLA